MTYFVTALTADKAQLIVHTMQTTDKSAANCVATFWAGQGYSVIRREEI